MGLISFNFVIPMSKLIACENKGHDPMVLDVVREKGLALFGDA